jgi:hypothetical protein
MPRLRSRFKPALVLLTALVTLWGCQSVLKSRRPEATLRLYLEVPSDRGGKSVPVPLMRANPYQINVTEAPFLDERYLTNVVQIAAIGGPAIELWFGTTGTKLLEQFSMGNRGRQFGILCGWGVGTTNVQSRWLAAPVFTRTITDGRIRFSPDASVEEVQYIMECLTNTLRTVSRTTGI